MHEDSDTLARKSTTVGLSWVLLFLFCFFFFGFLPMFTDVSRLLASPALNQGWVRQKSNTENSPLCWLQVPRERSGDAEIIQQKHEITPHNNVPINKYRHSWSKIFKMSQKDIENIFKKKTNGSFRTENWNNPKEKMSLDAIKSKMKIREERASKWKTEKYKVPNMKTERKQTEKNVTFML